jgi:hypothetical protein
MGQLYDLAGEYATGKSGMVGENCQCRADRDGFE